MTLQIDLTPEEENRISRAASMRGMDAVEFAHRLLIDSLPVYRTPANELTEDAFDALLDQLSEGLDPHAPPLSDEALQWASD